MYYHNNDTDQFHHTLNPSCCPFSINPSSHPQPLATTNMVDVHLRLVFLECQHNWSHIVCNLLGLVFSTQYNAFEIHPSCCMLSIVHSFLLLSTYHSLFIPSCFGGHLNYFYLNLYLILFTIRKLTKILS